MTVVRAISKIYTILFLTQVMNMFQNSIALGDNCQWLVIQKATSNRTPFKKLKKHA